MKYKRLTKEQFEELHQEFATFLATQSIDKNEWDEIKVKTPEVAEQELDVIEWAQRAEQLGAGEILLTSMDADGVQTGFDIALTSAVRSAVRVPVIASGGAGALEDFSTILKVSDAALAASVFHFGTLSIAEVKAHVAQSGIAVRS